MVNHYILLESDVLKTIVNAQDKVIVMFGSAFCTWCQQIVKKSLNNLAIENKDSILVYIDAENVKGGWNFPRSMRLLPKEPDQWPWWAYFNKGQCVDTITTSAIWEVKEWLNKQN